MLSYNCRDLLNLELPPVCIKFIFIAIKKELLGYQQIEHFTLPSFPINSQSIATITSTRNSIVALLQEVHRYYSGTLTIDMQHLFQKRWHIWLKNNNYGLIISYSHKKKNHYMEMPEISSPFGSFRKLSYNK